MNIKTFAFGCAALAASVVQAAVFPKAGGDMASADDWGGTLPAATETVGFTKAGTYTASADVSFNAMTVNVDKAVFDLTDGNRTVTLAGASPFIFYPPKNGSSLEMRGGKYTFSNGSANFRAIRVAKSNCRRVITDGAVVSGIGNLYLTSDLSPIGATLVISNYAKVTANEFRNSNNAMAVSNKLDIADGGQLELATRFYSETCGGSASVYAGMFAGHQIDIHGKDAKLVAKGASQCFAGNAQHGFEMHVRDGGSALATNGGFTFGNSTISTNALCEVVNGSTLQAKNFIMRAEGCRCEVSNSTFRASSLQVGLGTSNNVFRAVGSDSTVTIGGDVFGNGGHHNLISFEDGVQCVANIAALVTNGHHSVFSLTGSGTRFGVAAGDGNFYWGCHKDVLGQVQNSYSNTLYVGDGAKLEVARCVIAGQDNQLVVSNATVNFCDDSVGLRVGYNNAKVKDGNRVVLQGAMPKIYSVATANCFWFQNNSTLRFEIPEEGYAEGHVPIELTGCSFYIDVSNSKVEIDCDKFVEKTGGKLHLIHSKNKIDTSSTNNIKSYLLNQVKLPAGARIIVDGGDVYLKSPKRTGLTVIIR